MSEVLPEAPWVGRFHKFSMPSGSPGERPGADWAAAKSWKPRPVISSSGRPPHLKRGLGIETAPADLLQNVVQFGCEDRRKLAETGLGSRHDKMPAVPL